MNKLEEVIAALAENPNLHCHTTSFYKLCKIVAREIIEENFSEKSIEFREFKPFGKIAMPHVSMGNIDSLDLFGLDELIIFSFYQANKNRYKNTLDIGANIGLHSIIMAKCGFSVQCFEPDPWHFKILSENLKLNTVTNVKTNQIAVSNRDGTSEFIRLLDNTTGSHLVGAKNSYGKRESFEVKVQSAELLFNKVDFAKIDAEGHEDKILKTLTSDNISHIDIIVEIGNLNNANEIYKHINKIGGKMFSQKNGWQKVTKLEDLPTSHREGSLFISGKSYMPWNQEI